MAATADLAKTITFEELLGWRLHWVLCEVWQIDEQIKRRDRVTEELIIQLIEKLELAKNKYNRAIWEVETMLDSHYVTEAIKNHPKFICLTKAITETAEMITEMSSLLAQQKHEHVQAKLESAMIR